MDHELPKHILVVDDETSILKLLASVLGRRGVNVDTACSGREGLEKVQAHPYDLVITDLRMPGITGRDFLDAIREIRGAALPVIGMSGTPWMLEKAGFDAVLVKPFSQQALFETLDIISAGQPG